MSVALRPAQAVELRAVPPQSTGNKAPLRRYSLAETYVQAAGGRLRYTPEQCGSGAHSLCEKHHPSAVATLRLRLPVNHGFLPEDVFPTSAATV